LNVCIDIQPAIAQRAGVGRYTKTLVEHLGPLAGEDELDLFYFDFQRNGVSFPTPGAQQHAVRWCPGRLMQAAWRHLRFPPYDWLAPRADLYHFTNYIRPPLRRGKSVVSIHDMSFLRHPDTLEEKNYRYLSARLHDTAATADAIIAISHFGGDEIRELLGVPEDRVCAIPLGIDDDWQPATGDEIAAMRAALHLDRPYLLMVGTLEPRKNIAFLVDVFERLDAFDGDLVIAGMRGWKHEPILERMQASSRRPRIRYVEFVEDRFLPALYTAAEIFCFPSLYEGFGFPPLEAMACGTPVVSSTGGSLPEVLGEAAEVLDHFDADAWADTLARLLRDTGRRSERAAAGRARARTYTWTETARKTWALYRRVAS
jgi:glycosyltransferase involved in cell wall biosynthesis